MYNQNRETSRDKWASGFSTSLFKQVQKIEAITVRGEDESMSKTYQ